MSYLFNNEVEITQPVNQFGDLKVVQKTPVLETIPIVGFTALKDITRISGSGSVNDAYTEINLSTGATANSFAELDTAERGRYLSGLAGQVGLGLRIADTEPAMAGTSRIEWGYAKRINGGISEGILYTTEADGEYVEVIRGGVVVHRKHRNEWNLDPLDGSGPSGITWTPYDGTIYQVDFTWYGYGAIVWNILAIDPVSQKQIEVPFHVYRPKNSTSIRVPNLPVHIYIQNGDQSTDYQVYVGGRQFSIIGPFRPSFRLVTEHVYNKGTDTTLRPLFSFKSKEDERSLGVSKKISGFDITSTIEDLYVEVRIDAQVSNTQSFIVPGNHSDSEVSTLTDTTANTVTGGIPIWAGNIKVSGGGGPTEASGDKDTNGLFIDIPEEQICTVLVRTETGTGNATGTLRIREER